MFDLKGKRALVTGSSRGIGRAIAILLAKCGAEVIVHGASNMNKAQETVDIITASGGKATPYICDLCDREKVKNIINDIGNVDILVLNASMQIKKKWETITTEDFDKQVSCNFLASMLLIQSAVPYMREQKWGRIVTIGSVQEAKPHPDMLVYSGTKAAQTNMVQSLSLQLASDGITVNNVAPGVIYTDRNVEALSDPEYAAKVTASIPVGFYGEPKDCAPMVALLCSDEGRYVTGQNIFVDGGKSVQ
ncbi:MAG: SDR family oxidoreductase [Clostridia bacterium]|nr:SDR family oxidoreductase [Clostridia bacterium]